MSEIVDVDKLIEETLDSKLDYLRQGAQQLVASYVAVAIDKLGIDEEVGKRLIEKTATIAVLVTSADPKDRKRGRAQLKRYTATTDNWKAAFVRGTAIKTRVEMFSFISGLLDIFNGVGAVVGRLVNIV